MKGNNEDGRETKGNENIILKKKTKIEGKTEKKGTKKEKWKKWKGKETKKETKKGKRNENRRIERKEKEKNMISDEDKKTKIQKKW